MCWILLWKVNVMYRLLYCPVWPSNLLQISALCNGSMAFIFLFFTQRHLILCWATVWFNSYFLYLRIALPTGSLSSCKPAVNQSSRRMRRLLLERRLLAVSARLHTHTRYFWCELAVSVWCFSCRLPRRLEPFWKLVSPPPSVHHYAQPVRLLKVKEVASLRRLT